MQKTTSSVILNWAKSEAQEGISHYRVYMDDSLVGNTLDDTANYKIKNVELYVKHSFYVVGVTNKCRVTNKSNIVYITLPLSKDKSDDKLRNTNLNFNINKQL